MTNTHVSRFPHWPVCRLLTFCDFYHLRANSQSYNYPDGGSMWLCSVCFLISVKPGPKSVHSALCWISDGSVIRREAWLQLEIMQLNQLCEREHMLAVALGRSVLRQQLLNVNFWPCISAINSHTGTSNYNIFNINITLTSNVLTKMSL
ncbi:hypothetical protein MATL_G00199190 [Megalops atlanticus]|uniref:Uncharacterized protein n=1 Tax=Megalops atlanticus TaxID=7932 RepID=A0A9D3T155_MEGAT|nr:hypothetical protein MATL_G00199190 [Megalops atlanticus]